MRRDRAARSGVELFLYERAFADCLERIEVMDRRFTSALLIGCPDPRWPDRLRAYAENVDVRDPGPIFADTAHGETIQEDAWTPPQSKYELVVAIGTLDTVEDLQGALRLTHRSMGTGGLLIGAVSGGETLPRLRAAMRSADEVSGEALPHVHPRIEASALATLLASAGFANPVVDVDRVSVAYRSFEQLIRDLRNMGSTNILNALSRKPISRAARERAIRSFQEAGGGEPTIETFEILHFAAWSAEDQAPKQR